MKLNEFFSYVLNEALSATYDKFPKTFNEFEKLVDDECRKVLGNDYKDVIDNVQPMGKGATDEAIKQLWNGHWTAYEAEGEIAFMYDLAQKGINELNHYPYWIIKNGGKIERYDPKGVRTTRPIDKSFFTKNYWDDDDDLSASSDDFADLE